LRYPPFFGGAQEERLAGRKQRLQDGYFNQDAYFNRQRGTQVSWVDWPPSCR